MKKIFIGFLFFLAGCSNNLHEHSSPSRAFKVLGSPTSNQTWIYLCGLVADFVPEHMDNLKIIDELGKQINVRFLAMIPKSRCPQLNNRLCWPHDTDKELLQTYQEIINAVHDYPVQGYIGFSNGGFFLNKLAQFVDIDKLIISIGAAGPLFNKQGPINTVHLLIGKKDQWHYQHAINLYDQSKDANLTIHLVEYDDGHQVPVEALKKLIKNLSKSNENG